MNLAEVNKLMSSLKIAVKTRHRNLRNMDGPEGRMLKLRKSVTALFKYERLEMNYNRADEARGYAERLISDALRNGDKHRPTMEMADYWLLEKQLVHKLFKVLCPRYENYNTSVTRMYKAPREYPCNQYDRYQKRSILELRGNPYPSVLPDQMHRNRNLIHNVLLDEAKKEFYIKKSKEITEEVKKNENMPDIIITKENVEKIVEP